MVYNIKEKTISNTDAIPPIWKYYGNNRSRVLVKPPLIDYNLYEPRIEFSASGGISILNEVRYQTPATNGSQPSTNIMIIK